MPTTIAKREDEAHRCHAQITFLVRQARERRPAGRIGIQNVHKRHSSTAGTATPARLAPTSPAMTIASTAPRPPQSARLDHRRTGQVHGTRPRRTSWCRRTPDRRVERDKSLSTTADRRRTTSRDASLARDAANTFHAWRRPDGRTEQLSRPNGVMKMTPAQRTTTANPTGAASPKLEIERAVLPAAARSTRRRMCTTPPASAFTPSVMQPRWCWRPPSA